MDVERIKLSRIKFNYSYPKKSNMTVNMNQVERAHQTARMKGFWDATQDIVTKMNLIREEVGELTSAIRAGKIKPTEEIEIPFVDPDFKTEMLDYSAQYARIVKGTAEEELADIVIRIYDLIGSDEQFKLVFEVCDVDPELEPTLENQQQIISYIYHLVGVIADLYTHSTVHKHPRWSSEEMRPQVALAILLYRVVHYCNELAIDMGIDLELAVERKMHYNLMRPFMHGKKY